jgi:hypothetical protein
MHYPTPPCPTLTSAPATHVTDQTDWARGSGSLEEEHDGCEPGEDDEPDHDNEFDFPRERRKYIADRQQPGRGHIWQGGRLIYRPSYRQVTALAAKKRKRA